MGAVQERAVRHDLRETDNGTDYSYRGAKGPRSGQVRAKMNHFSLQDEEDNEETEVPNSQARHLTADERATEKITRQAPVGRERVENNCACVRDKRCDLNAEGSIAQPNEKRDPPRKA